MSMDFIAGSAAANLGGSIFSGLMGASGSKKMADAIRNETDKGSETALELNTCAQKDLHPSAIWVLPLFSSAVTPSRF